MKKTPVGIRFTTGCGHSWKRPHARWSAADLRGAVADCRVCDEYLLIVIPDDVPADRVPADVHCPRFHPYLAQLTNGDWPADGAGTFAAAFDAH
ncbi:hypothetical protein [Streptomyces sp. NBC_01244]|uniref:hypothetical protein n=1 Tax=Streptomyces sp. NBC_01244 TaxID=2903797 RepID=UPI002E0D1E57|nr:hypothetical protein OG247_44115 [Streptomyces sp. NBC_01244]